MGPVVMGDCDAADANGALGMASVCEGVGPLCVVVAALPATWVAALGSVKVRGGAAGSRRSVVTGCAGVGVEADFKGASGRGEDSRFGDAGFESGFSMLIIVSARDLSARGKMGDKGASLVPGFSPPHFRSFSSPLRAASSMVFGKPSCFQTEAVA